MTEPMTVGDLMRKLAELVDKEPEIIFKKVYYNGCDCCDGGGYLKGVDVDDDGAKLERHYG